MAEFVFNGVEMGAPIEVFQLSKMYNDDAHPDKVNLGVGAYRTDEGKPWVLPVVSAAEMQMASDKTLNHEYLPVSGLPDFREAAIKLLLGSHHKSITENKVEAFQSLGGTGSLRLAAAFLKELLHYDTVYVSKPTWGNHKGIFKSAGFSNIKEYKYWDNDSLSINVNGMIDDLNNAPEKSVVILHAVAHNPTGYDPTKEQWEQIYNVCKQKKLFVLFDIAYQGFASGNLEEDGWAVRYFADQDIDLFVAQSFSKNFGLYNERVGSLIVVSKDTKKLPEIRSQMELVIRTLYSNPSNHGARIVATVLNNKAYYDDWKGQLSSMACRIKKMRQELVEHLKKLGTPGNWDHIIKQIGMFSFTGLNVKQVEHMKSKHIYLLNNGRISLAGMTPKNVGYVAKAIDEAVRMHPNLRLSEDAGLPGAVIREVVTFADLAKRRLQDAINVVISTGVTIDGVMIKTDAEGNARTSSFVFEKSESDILDFVKVQLKGSMSDIITPELKTSDEVVTVDKSKSKSAAGLKEDPKLETDNASLNGAEIDALSVQTHAGTLHNSFKTFSSRGVQAGDDNTQKPEPAVIPARFKGSMMTPVYFDGLMMTPEKLEKFIQEAMKNEGNMSIPVEFSGGMITSAFRSLSGDQPMIQLLDGSSAMVKGDNAAPIKVKFEGRLQGILDSELCSNGMPVVFNGTMSKT